MQQLLLLSNSLKVHDKHGVALIYVLPVRQHLQFKELLLLAL